MATAKKAATKKSASAKKVANKKEAKGTPKCTVFPALWEVWLSNKREGDIPKIMQIASDAKIPCSKPVVTKALLYGYCISNELRDVITQYYADRYNKERGQAEMLNELYKGNKKK